MKPVFCKWMNTQLKLIGMGDGKINLRFAIITDYSFNSAH